MQNQIKVQTQESKEKRNGISQNSFSAGATCCFAKNRMKKEKGEHIKCHIDADVKEHYILHSLDKFTITESTPGIKPDANQKLKQKRGNPTSME